MLNRALLADMIGDAYRIIEAEDGKQAVAALQKEGAGISLVLLDYVMPQMNGFDVLEVIDYLQRPATSVSGATAMPVSHAAAPVFS